MRNRQKVCTKFQTKMEAKARFKTAEVYVILLILHDNTIASDYILMYHTIITTATMTKRYQIVRFNCLISYTF